jgi:hypothetical protein
VTEVTRDGVRGRGLCAAGPRTVDSGLDCPKSAGGRVPDLSVQRSRIEDVDAIWPGCHQPGEPEVTQDPGHHLADRADRIGQLLLGHLSGQLAVRALLRGLLH